MYRFGSGWKKQQATRNRETLNYMDINTIKKEDSLELARELLIAISHSVPEKHLNSKSAYENSFLGNGIAVSLSEEDRADKLRSELISISYLPSLDKIALPEVGGL